MMPFGGRGTGSPQPWDLPKRLARKEQLSSPGLLVSNPHAPRLSLFHQGLSPHPLGILSHPFLSVLSSLEYQHSLPTSLVRIK